MIAAPHVARAAIGSPVYRPTRAPAYRGGGAASVPFVPPATAVYMPPGATLPGPRFHVNPGALAPGGVLGGFSFFGWMKVVSQPQQYIGLLTAETGEYLFLGHDQTAGGSQDARGLFFYDGHGGGNGGHSFETLPDHGTWFHFAFSIWFPSEGNCRGRAWIDGVPCTWDSSPAVPTDCELVGLPWNGTTNIELANQDWDQTATDGAVRAWGLVGKTPLTTAEVLLLRSQSVPGTGVTALAPLGIWPLTTKDDLGSAQGVSLTVVNGPLNPDSTPGPAGITVP